MKSLNDLSTALLGDLGSICSVETTRDLQTIKARAGHEGIEFYTLTLPAFADDFERCLDKGRVDSGDFPGWKLVKSSVIPEFLQGFTSLVFGAGGELHDEPFIPAIYAVRQLCRFFKKVRIPCTEKRVDAAFAKFLANEADFHDACNLDQERLDHFRDVADLLWLHVFGSREFNSLELVPKHGPGATADRVCGNRKYSHPYWHQRLEGSFPFLEYIFTSLSQLDCEVNGLQSIKLVQEQDELPVRVIQVPKTLKGPRIIAIEPVCMQYTQQAVSRWIMGRIARSPLTRESIRFTDQTVNQRMAIYASIANTWATIDLSDASDRVPWDMVQLMLGSQPDLLQAISCCRSTRAKLPDGSIISLKKFASMGSALCFPIESMYFATVIVHGILWEQRTSPTYSRIRRILSNLHLFGDDIIVPTQETGPVIRALTAFNCKVNSAKSFLNGYFKESCGCDAYSGTDITPVYLRELAPDNRQSSVRLQSWISTSNQLHWAGCWKTADYMKSVVENILGELPTLFETSPGLGWYSFVGCVATGYCNKLHQPVVRTYVIRPIRKRDPLDGYPALLKYFLNLCDDGTSTPISSVNKEHLRFSAQRGAVSRKRHWVPAM